MAFVPEETKVRGEASMHTRDCGQHKGLRQQQRQLVFAGDVLYQNYPRLLTSFISFDPGVT